MMNKYSSDLQYLYLDSIKLIIEKYERLFFLIKIKNLTII